MSTALHQSNQSVHLASESVQTGSNQVESSGARQRIQCNRDCTIPFHSLANGKINEIVKSTRLVL